MPPNFILEHLQTKGGDSASRVQGYLGAVCWKNKQEVCVLSSMHLIEAGRAVKPLVFKHFNTHLGYVDLSNGGKHLWLEKKNLEMD
jgi:hypothetical protein